MHGLAMNPQIRRLATIQHKNPSLGNYPTKIRHLATI